MRYVRYEQVFALENETVDQALERGREERRRELRAVCEQRARLDQRVTEIVRDADDHGDWQAAGCSSSARWLAQVTYSDHRTAERITRTSEALRVLPAIDHAMSTGLLTLDQAAAAAEHATPETDAETARIAVGKASAADALVTLAQHGGTSHGGVKRSPTTLIVHVSDDGPALLRAQARSALRLRSASPATRAVS